MVIKMTEKELKMDNCPRCELKGTMKKIDLTLIKDDRGFYDIIFQCTDCKALFQHVLRRSDNHRQYSGYVTGAAFLYYDKKTGKWRY